MASSDLGPGSFSSSPLVADESVSSVSLFSFELEFELEFEESGES